MFPAMITMPGDVRESFIIRTIIFYYLRDMNARGSYRIVVVIAATVFMLLLPFVPADNIARNTMG